ncbi:hypothetical protein D3C76_1792610 [compost metagenome]
MSSSQAEMILRSGYRSANSWNVLAFLEILSIFETMIGQPIRRAIATASQKPGR